MIQFCWNVFIGPVDPVRFNMRYVFIFAQEILFLIL